MSSIRFGATGVSALFVLGGALTGCGSKPAETPASPSVAATSEPAPLPPLTPLAASPELFAVARIANLEKVADTSTAWSGMPVPWRSLLEKEVPGLTRIAVLSAPVDFAATIDPGAGDTPRFFWAFSIGVASTDAAVSFFRQQQIPVTPADAGTYRVSIGSDLSCVVARALGAAPARVVCSDNADGAGGLYPYMTRGMPTETFGTSDIHAHVIAEPFRRRYGTQVGLVRTVGVPFLLRELSVDNPKLDRALHEVLYGGADELVALASDADRFDMDMGVAPGSDVLDASFSLTLAGQKSWWGGTMAKASTQMGPAPEVFWKLPANASSATFSAYSNAEQFHGIAIAMRDLLDGFADYEKLSEARRRALVDASEKVFGIGAKSAAAALPLSPQPAGSSSAADMIRLTVGQHVGISDKGGPEVTALFSELTKSLNDKALRTNLAKQLEIPVTLLPTAREKALTGKGLPTGGKRFELVIPGAWYDGSDREFSLDNVKARAKAKGKPVPPQTVVLLTVPDGASMWLGVGTDEKQLVAAITEGRAGTGKTLATREGLASFRTEPVLSGGFATLAGVLGNLDRRVLKRDSPLPFDKLPHLGMTPILMTATATMKGQGPKVTFSARVPKAVVEDSVALAATEVVRSIIK